MELEEFLDLTNDAYPHLERLSSFDICPNRPHRLSPEIPKNL